MAREYVLGPLDAIPKGEGRSFAVAGTDIAVFRTHDDAVFATQTKCPHKAGPLADGLIGGTTLICPLHERGFDLRSGAGIGHEDCLKVYPARVSEDRAVVVSLTL